MNIKLKTNNPVATKSNDHLAPWGTSRDNNTNVEYINAVKNYFKKNQLRILDLGCAGGQLISDFIKSGEIGVGLEGSSHALNGAGKNNWDKYLDKNLFLCDLTKNYQLYEDNKEMKFDFITSWEVLEHIAYKDIPKFLDSVKNHLDDDGVFCCSIGLAPCFEVIDGIKYDRHQSVFNPAKWLNILFENGFELCTEENWAPMAQKYMPPGVVYDKNLGFDNELEAGVVLKDQGWFFGYLFGDNLFRNHAEQKTSIYFCLRKK